MSSDNTIGFWEIIDDLVKRYDISSDEAIEKVVKASISGELPPFNLTLNPNADWAEVAKIMKEQYANKKDRI